MDKNTRHSTCIHHPETAALGKYVLTLLAQRRELRLSDIQELLRSGTEEQTNNASLVHKLALQAASSKALDLERHLLQKELTLALDSSFGCARNGVDAMHDAIQRAGTPLAGVPAALGLLWFCKSRQASLAVEQQELQNHIAAVHAAHLQHVLHAASRNAPGVPTHPMPHYQFDHAGPLQANGVCACEKELTAAEQCMAAVLHAQADMAARVARLAGGFNSRTATGAQYAVLESDWQAALLHAAWVAPGGRFAKRLAARIAILPQSHNHRFPALEQVAGEDLARDRRMAGLNLRHPPHVVRHASVAAGLVGGFIESMDLHARLSSAAREAAANDDTVPTEVSGDVLSSSDANIHHHHLYITRRALPVLLRRQDELWPEMPLEPSDQPARQQDQKQQQQEAQARPGSPNRRGQIQGGYSNGDSSPASANRPQMIFVEDCMTDKLAALTPSLEGDDSASSIAALRAVCLHIDEGLKAEAAYLETPGSQQEVRTRMQLLSQSHAARWSLPDPVATANTQAAASTGALAAAVAADAAKSLPAHLEPKEMESYYTLRFLKTRGDRLKVLHYLNATVSLQLQLLHDEEGEAQWVDPLVTCAHKPFTCPVSLAHANKAEAELAEMAGVRPANGDQASGNETPYGTPGERGMEGLPSSSAAASSGGDNSSGRKPKFEPDFWEADEYAGVAVRRSDGRWVVYRHALTLFRQLEGELLRLGTHYMECYAHQLHGVGRGAEAEELSRQSLLVDIWHHEAQFLGARHYLLLAYMSAYRHAADFGIEDLFVQLDLHTQQSASAAAPSSPRGKVPPGPDSAFAGSGLYRPEFLPGNKEHASRASSQQAPGKQADVAANAPQPLLLGARKQLRREMMDICFRRPKLSVDDGYFVGRAFRATKTMEMEAVLVRQLCLASARADRESLAGMSRTAAMRAKGSNGSGTGENAQPEGGAHNLWQPGLPPGIVYGPFLSNVMPQVQPLNLDDWHGLLRGCAMLTSVGAAAAMLPGVIRKAVGDLAEVHQVRHYLELAELRRTVLQYATIEMGVLLQEEVYRAFAAPSKIPKDSKFRSQAGSIGNYEAEQELQDDVALQTLQLNWLLRSHVADNPLMLLGVITEVGCSSKAALEAVLCKEHLVRRLYQSEVLGLVYQAQSRALGKKMVTQELQGIDWASLNTEGQPLKPDQLSDAWTACEPSDTLPPGALGPEQMGSSICSPMQYAVDLSGDEASGSYVMLAIGRTGVLGGVWRAPPLALAEYSTSMAEMLQVHSLSGLQTLLHPKGNGHTFLAAAAQAQALRCSMLHAAITHNQVLLDFVVRRLDLLRRMLLWQSASVEGAQPDESMDVRVGAPPRSYRPSFWTPTNQVQPYELMAKPPPLLTDPPLPRTLAYRQAHPKRDAQKEADVGSSCYRSESSSAGAKAPAAVTSAASKVEEMLSPAAITKFANIRRRLVDSVSPLWLDMHALKMRMRAAACQAFVHGMAGVTEHARDARRQSIMCGRFSTSQIPALEELSENDGKEDPSSLTMTRADTVKLEVWSMVYLRGMAAALEGPMLRTELAGCARQLALSVLGSTGGKGNRWGLRLNAEKQCMEVDPQEMGPGVHWLTSVEGGAEGAERLEILLRDYGPLWQAANLSPIALEAEVWEYKPPPPGRLPPGLMFLDKQGQLRLDHIWQLPTQLEVLAMGLAPSGDRFALQSGSQRQRTLATRPSQLSRADSTFSVGLSSGQPSPSDKLLEESNNLGSFEASKADLSDADPVSPRAALGMGRQKLVLKLEPLDVNTKHHLVLGIQVAQLMWLHVRTALFKALLLAPSAQLAHGGDASLMTDALPYAPEEKPLAAALLEPKQWKKKFRSSKAAGNGVSPSAGSPEGLKAGEATTFSTSPSMAPSDLGPVNRVPAENAPDMLGENSSVRGGATASNRHAAANKWRDTERGPGGMEERESTRAGGATEEAGVQGLEEEGQWMQREFLSGRQLLDHMGQVSASRMAPFLPGALLVSSLSGLRSRLAYLVQPQSKAKGKATTPAVASNVVPAPEATHLLAREAGVHGMSALVAVTRARDAFTMTPTRHAAWHLTGALEGTLARALVSAPSDQPNLIAMAMLRMRDAERVALHNELEHVELVLERIVQEECGVSLVLHPGAAVSLAEYALAGIWAHDRLRDGLVWRAMLMETPTQYPGVVPKESDFLRRYHDAPLLLLPVGPCQPISPSVRAWMERTYEARVTAKAQALLASAANFASPAIAAPEAAAKFGQVPGHPAWIAQSPMWASREGRAVEAALCIMKQEVDMQAMQVALLRLHKDCAQLAGLAVRESPTSEPAQTLPGGLRPDTSLSAPLHVMVRHLLARKQLATHQDGDGIMYEVCAEDMAAWLSEAVAAAAAEGLATAKAACQAAAEERAKLAQLASCLSSKVSAAVSDHGMHIRRHAIRVESHLVDRAMLLLQELSYVRRAAVRSYEDAANAYEIAYMAAQTQHANIIKDLQNALLVAHSNTELQRANMQRMALEAMMEVRRETLQKAFGSSSLARAPTTSVKGAGPQGNNDEDSADALDSEEGDAAPLDTRPSSPSKAAPLDTWPSSPSKGAALASQPLSPSKASIPQRPGPGRPMSAASAMPRSLAGQGRANLPRAASSAVPDTRPSRPETSAQPGQGAGREGGGEGVGGGIARILDLESQIETLEAEIIDMQRAIVKVQTWFKMRSGAFQAACMKEVVEGRARVNAIEGALWDLREAYELKLENASIQLKATQADLEVAVSGLARSSTDLTHALSSNKRLLLWKVTQAPRVEAMRTQLMAKSISLGPSSTEAWLELIGSKDGQLGTEPLLQQRQESNEDPAARQSPRKQQQQQQQRQQKDLQLPPDQGWLEERQALQDELASLRRQLAAQQQHQHRQVQQTPQPLAPVPTDTDTANNRAKSDGGASLAVANSAAGQADQGFGAAQGAVRDATADREDQGFWATQGQEEVDVGDAAPSSGGLDQEELQAAYNKAVIERSELQRLLEAVRTVAPEVVHAAEQAGGQWAPSALTGQSHAPFVTSTSAGGNDVPTASMRKRPHSGRITRPSSPPHGPLSTFHSDSPRLSLPLGLHTIDTTSSPSHHSASSATHPFIRSLQQKTRSPASPSSPQHTNPASSSNSPHSTSKIPRYASHSPRYTRPKSAAAASTAQKPFADTANPTPLGGTAPPSFSVAGPRHPHSPAGPAMRLAATASPSPLHASSHPSTRTSVEAASPLHDAHPFTRSNVDPASPLHTSQPSTRNSMEAAGTSPRGQSAVARPSGFHSHHPARRRPGSAVPHLREGANPGSPHHTSVQTETPSLQVTASKLSVDPVPASQSGVGSTSTSVHNKFPAGRAMMHGGASSKAMGHPRPASGKNSKVGKEWYPEGDAGLTGW